MTCRGQAAAAACMLLVGGAAARADAGPPRLAGVFVSPAHRSAIFEASRGVPTVVEEGERIGDYLVRAIAPDSVEIERDGKRLTVEPSAAGGGTAAAVRTPEPAGVTFGQVVNPRMPSPD